MAILNTLGSRIRKIRDQRKLTREDVCDDEFDLSVRQLARIEKGESVPSLCTLAYIADKLKVKIEVLLNPSNTCEYCEMKDKIELLAVDYSTKQNRKIDEMLALIYEHYYDELPYDEKMYVDCSATSHEVRQTLDPSIAVLTLEKYHHVLTSTEAYSSGELAYLALYTWIVGLEMREVSGEIGYRLLDIHRFIETADQLSIELTIRIQLNIAEYLYNKGEYEACGDMIHQANTLANEKKSFQRLPIMYLLRAKCSKEVGKINEAHSYYYKASTLAHMLQLSSVEMKVKAEYKRDFPDGDFGNL